MNIKIAVIGAGSAVFSVNMIKDICLTTNLEGSTISFMDIDKDRLDNVYNLCKRYSEEAKIKLTLEKTTDLKQALKAADYVINAALVTKGYDRWEEGWSIAYKHGYKFGGSFSVVHDEAFWTNFYQLELMESILKNIMDICPKAWYIIIANPVIAAVTYLCRKYKEANIVGLCHGYNDVYRLSEVIGLEREHIAYEMSGVNHFIWMTEFNYKGKNAYPILDNWIETKSEKFWKNKNLEIEKRNTCWYSISQKKVDLYKRFGVFPIGDTGSPGGGSWGWWYHTDDKTELKWNENPKKWFEEFLKGGKKEVEKIREISKNKEIKVMDVFPPGDIGESVIPIIESLAYNIPREIIVNILNEGEFVEGVPKDFQVEIPAIVDKNGIKGKKVSKLPQPVMSYMLRDRVAPVELEISAFENGSRELLLNLILMDPWTRSKKQATDLLNDILSLPYHERLRNHYK
ncbi:MAG: family 4 glycosyl hydrolase [Candidatus Humimicrobiaceae bacterium]